MAIPDIQAEIDLRQLWRKKTGGHYQDRQILLPMMAATNNVTYSTYSITSRTGWWCRCGADVWDSQ